jgi:NADPH2:quinone reductase
VFGEPENLIVADVELPAPRSGQVRVALRAAGVNFADYLIVTGKYQIKPALPFTPGLEAAGEIVEFGPGIDDLQLGQRVAVVTRPGGCYATGAVIEAAHVVPLPGGIDFVTAACVPVAYGTAHFALSHRGRLRAGETLLVTGAAGGVGLAAVEVGKALGARVIAAARGQDRLDLARSRGADELVDYGAESLRVDYGTEMDGPPALRARLTEVLSWFAQGRLKPHISARLPLNEAGSALRQLADRAAYGKIALAM